MQTFLNKIANNNITPIILAPLAGVSDVPFRMICKKFGADLTYVEMISANALLHENKKTLRMLHKLEDDDSSLGVQLVASDVNSLCKAIDIIQKFYEDVFDTIDINMGCPAPKVIKLQGGAFLLQDPKNIYAMVYNAKNYTNKPLSVKIRLGWDRAYVNYLEIVDAIEKAGADWICVHGRYKHDSYSIPVDLKAIQIIKQKSKIPIIGNGNVFGYESANLFFKHTCVDGLMVARGALGNPWIFAYIKGQLKGPLDIDLWYEGVRYHIEVQKRYYQELSNMTDLNLNQFGVCLRKHIIWYTKGLEGAKKIRETINTINNIDDALELITKFYNNLKYQGVRYRDNLEPSDLNQLFVI